ncbi:hypothetical protein [Persicitalea jodogahamensis]|uniref:Uncharacterized protein n=1 Tax=Persicitalea jodogahamensis TaxID=402147 RepID=A0A8J3D0A2_9BACT|nr:hypothetical protein [Persicitalea jodogahamensis]GHB52379.1 hypothetical protein GCM10007390_01270 [Persicitalea jodogahamensis]
MKTKTALLLLVLGLHSCNSPDEVPDDRAAIKSISFEGVPAQNVTIDRALSTINIRIPTELRGGLRPVLELNEGASVVGGLTADGLVNLGPYCSCYINGAQSQIVVDKESSNSSLKYRRSYAVKIVNQGPLKALDSTIPLTFSRKTNRLVMHLPVENLYTNPRISQLKFTNVETGVGPLLDADGNCLNSCSNSAINQLIFNFSAPTMSVQYLMPGTYTVSANGIEFPQKLVVTE